MIKYLPYIILLFLFSFSTYSAENVDSSIEIVEESEEEERTAPIIEITPSTYLEHITIPSFINKDANSIIYNGANWESFYSGLSNLKQDNLNSDNVVILHVGDSHIQADVATRRVREQLQLNYGNAGRGLIIPFRLAKTNEPVDYSIKSNNSFSSASLLRKPWSVDVGFTGVALSPQGNNFDFAVANLPTSSGTSPFDIIKIYHDGEIAIDDVIVDNASIENNAFSDIGGTVIPLPTEMTSVELKMSCTNKVPRIFGFELGRATNGVVYNTIGNNGAAYSHYDELAGFEKWSSLLTPQLVIISLGSNEAFGNITNESFYKSIDRLVKKIRDEMPQSLILLTTPMECQRAYKVYRRGGKRKRRVRVKQYAINKKIDVLRKEILRYGRNNKIAVWDWYAVSGGAGASNYWLSEKLLSHDRIHNTAAGYQLQGELLFEVLTKEVK